MRALVLAFAPALASAYGIGLGEVSFVGEITAILVVLVVFSVGETAMWSVWLNFAFFCILVGFWVIFFGVAGSMDAATVAADQTVLTTLGAALPIADAIAWRLKRCQWRRKVREHAA